MRFINLRHHSIPLYLVCLTLMGTGCNQPDIPTIASGIASDTDDSNHFSLSFKSPSPDADSLLTQSEQLIEVARYDSAITLSRQARERYVEIAYREGIIRSENAEGDALERMGKYDEAMQLLAITMQKGIDWFGADHILLADTYNKMGVLKKNKGDFIESLEYYEKALAIRREKLSANHALVGRSINNIGVVYAEMGDFDRALDNYKVALEIRRTALGEKNVDVAQDYNNIAVALKNKGDYTQSLLYHDRALSIRREVLGDHHPSVGASYYNMGVTFSETRDYENAIKNHQKSLNIWQNAFPDGHYVIGLNYNALSIDHQRIKELVKAIMYEEKSLAEKVRTLDENHNIVGTSYQNIGIIYKYLGDYDRALFYLKLCAKNWRNSLGVSHPSMAFVYKELGELYYENEQYALAISYADSALRSNNYNYSQLNLMSNINIDNFSSEENLIEVLMLRAKAYRKMSFGDYEILSEVLQIYRLASVVINQYRSSFKNIDSKLLLAEQAFGVYESAISLARQLYKSTGEIYYLDTALQFAEKGKVSVLLDAMNESDARKFAGIPDSLLQQEKELRVLLTYYDKSLKEEEIKGDKADQDKVNLWKKEVFNLKKAYDDMLEMFEQDYPSYYDLRYKSYEPSIADIREKMIEPDEVLLEYVVGNDSLYIFAITDVQHKVVSMPRDSTLETNVENLRRGIVERNREFYVPAASWLYDTLIQPVAEVVRDYKKWVVVPDGALNTIPFEAFLSYPVPVYTNYSEMPFLIDDHIIRYTYSATLEISQMALQEVLDEEKTSKPNAKDFIAFAPVFKEGFPGNSRGAEIVNRIKPDSVESDSWGHLPLTELEVKAIDQMFKKRYSFWDRWFGRRSRLYLSDHASEAKLKSMDLRSHRFIHFATHGIVNEDVPELSGIILSQDTTGGEDGVLHMGEVYNLDMDADLVVLSACQTGYGKMAKGEGLISLTRGFMYAGADALLASLWQVEDRSTQEIMVDFYQRKLNGQSSAEAIREAKVTLMDYHPILAQPYYWSSFILIGK